MSLGAGTAESSLCSAAFGSWLGSYQSSEYMDGLCSELTLKRQAAIYVSVLLMQYTPWAEEGHTLGWWSMAVRLGDSPFFLARLLLRHSCHSSSVFALLSTVLPGFRWVEYAYPSGRTVQGFMESRNCHFVVFFLPLPLLGSLGCFLQCLALSFSAPSLTCLNSPPFDALMHRSV